MKKVKFVLMVLTVSIFASIFTGCGSKPQAEKVTINFFNWGDYIDESTVAKFEKKYPNIKVNCEYFTTNEDMYVKIKSGGSDYDIAIPSDYMIQRMLDEGMLKKINLDNIPNFKYIDDRFTNLDFDPDNEYSVPYLWGTVGILYNKTLVSDPVDTWQILWNKKYEKQIVMPDSERDSIGITLKMLGYSMNTRDINQLEEAKQKLIEQKPLVLSYVVDEVKDLMVGGNAALAVVWSGDAYASMMENEDLAYSIPKEGSNLWFDSMVIPITSKHQEEAELFINFMCEPEIAYANASYIGYATPHTEAFKMLDPWFTSDPFAYPSAEFIKDNLEIFRYPGDEINKIYSRIWTEVKAY